MKQKVYFANRDPKDCVSVLESKIENWETDLVSSGMVEKIRRSWAFYHGSFNGELWNYDDHKISPTGDQGELLNFPVNHFRNIAQHMLNMTVGNRPAMQAKSINTDYKSQAQTTLANGLLDYYMREKNLEDVMKRACEYAIVLSEGWIKVEWNSTGGDQYGFNEETNTPIYEGDINYVALTPLDVIRDVNRNDSEEQDWYIIKSYRNRYDLIAKFPDLADEIMAIQTRDNESAYRLPNRANDKSDDIPIYEFYHRRTDAVPDGKYILFMNDECIPVVSPLPYRHMPVFSIMPSKMIGTAFGYTIMFDILPIQEAINMLYSTILSNQNALGVQNVVVDKGSDLNLSQLGGGLNIIEVNPGGRDPRSLNLTSTPPEVFNMLRQLEGTVETISGINSVLRGNPEASLRSGSALALVQAQAIQFASGLQQSYVKLIENIGTATIRVLQDFAEAPRVAAIVGVANRTYLKEFTGEDISSINRVVVEVANPLSKTTAGRSQMATELIQYGIIDDVNQYFSVLNTGNLDVMTQGKQHELLLIEAENEKLMQGTQVPVLAVDSHLEHIKNHKSILFDPDLRDNPMLVQTTLEHIQEHINQLRSVDPALLQLIGQQPLQQAMPMEDEQLPSDSEGGAEVLEQPLPVGTEAAAGIAEPNMPEPASAGPGVPMTPQQNMEQITG